MPWSLKPKTPPDARTLARLRSTAPTGARLDRDARARVLERAHALADERDKPRALRPATGWALAIVLAAAVFLSVAGIIRLPWAPSPAELASAAIAPGDDVLHLLVHWESTDSFGETQSSTEEYWLDEKARVMRTEYTSGIGATGTTLATDSGERTLFHVDAKAYVRENPGSFTLPYFLTDLRDLLQTGRAKDLGTARLDGTPVRKLQLTQSDERSERRGWVATVYLRAEDWMPLRIESVQDEGDGGAHTERYEFAVSERVPRASVPDAIWRLDIPSDAELLGPENP